MLINKPATEVRIEESAIPVSKNPKPRAGASHCTSSAVRAAPSTAAATIVRVANVPTPVAMTAIVPSVAPLDKPIRVGSASGLRNIPCAIEPAIPSPAPIMIAPSARGKRSCQTVVASTLFLPISDQSDSWI